MSPFISPMIFFVVFLAIHCVLHFARNGEDAHPARVVLEAVGSLAITLILVAIITTSGGH